jgi:hypothetical protein
MPNTILKRWNGSTFEELYPKTVTSQIAASGTANSSTFLRGDGQWATPSGTVTGVTGTSPIASSGGTAPVISLAASYGDTQNPYASKTTKTFLAAPNAANGVPTFRTILASDIPTLNQNTTGSAATLTTARTLTVGSTGKTFNGSANVAWSLAEIGAAATSHTHAASAITSGTFDAARIPNAGTTTVGGVKVRLSGSTLFITSNGNNP